MTTTDGDLTPRYPARRPLLWPDRVLDLQAWLADNAPEPVYAVGGAVRDALLHRPVKDLDLAVADASITVARQLADAFNGDVYVMDRERGVARVLLADALGERLTLDVVRFRAGDLLGDLRDRDFTINAMAVAFTGDPSLLIDPLGGENDLHGKLLRLCTPQSIAADPLRSLRAVRQSVQLHFHMDNRTLAEARAHAGAIMTTSAERVRDEFFKLLNLDRAAAALRVADRIGLLAHIVPETRAMHGHPLPAPHDGDAWKHTLLLVERLHNLLIALGPRRTDETAAAFGMGMLIMQIDRYRNALYRHVSREWPQERSHRALWMLTALLHTAGDERAAERAASLALSNKEIERLQTLIRYQPDLLNVAHADPLSVHRFWYPLDEAGVDVVLFAAMDYLAMMNTELRQVDWLRVVDQVRVLLKAYYEDYETLIQPPVLLNGNELMAELALQPGRIIKTLLDGLREAQVRGEVVTREDALRVARRMLDQP